MKKYITIIQWTNSETGETTRKKPDNTLKIKQLKEIKHDNKTIYIIRTNIYKRHPQLQLFDRGNTLPDDQK